MPSPFKLRINRCSLALALSIGLLFQPGNLWGQEPSRSSKTEPHVDSAPSDMGKRIGTRWILPIPDEKPLRLPRVYASLREVYFEAEPERKLSVRPGVESWEIIYPGKPTGSSVVLEFESVPLLKNELKPIQQLGDGSLTLHCSFGQTVGSKLRFEPQPRKNTIGYWAEAKDRVFWNITVSQPGTFNVGLLQGAGNSGGGIAKVSILDQQQKTVDSLNYQVKVTGHYQNFIWNHAGSLDIPAAGEYRVQVEPIKIDKAALMDLRQIHLSPERGNHRRGK